MEFFKTYGFLELEEEVQVHDFEELNQLELIQSEVVWSGTKKEFQELINKDLQKRFG